LAVRHCLRLLAAVQVPMLAVQVLAAQVLPQQQRIRLVVAVARQQAALHRLAVAVLSTSDTEQHK
jgi:hypothetical protein